MKTLFSILFLMISPDLSMAQSIGCPYVEYRLPTILDTTLVRLETYLSEKNLSSGRRAIYISSRDGGNRYAMGLFYFVIENGMPGCTYDTALVRMTKRRIRLSNGMHIPVYTSEDIKYAFVNGEMPEERLLYSEHSPFIISYGPSGEIHKTWDIVEVNKKMVLRIQ